MLLLKDQVLRHVTSRRLVFSYRRFEELYFHVQGQAVQGLDGTMILRNVVNYLPVVFRVEQSKEWTALRSIETSFSICQSYSGSGSPKNGLHCGPSKRRELFASRIQGRAVYFSTV